MKIKNEYDYFEEKDYKSKNIWDSIYYLLGAISVLGIIFSILIGSNNSGLKQNVRAMCSLDSDLSNIVAWVNNYAVVDAIATNNVNINAIVPVSGKIVSTFGFNKDSKVFEDYILIETAEEDRVRSILDGVIYDMSEENGVWKVEIEHKNDWHSIYVGLDEPMVSIGDEIKQGEVFGKVKNQQIKFSVYHLGEAMDPLRVIANDDEI